MKRMVVSVLLTLCIQASAVYANDDAPMRLVVMQFLRRG